MITDRTILYRAVLLYSAVITVRPCAGMGVYSTAVLLPASFARCVSVWLGFRHVCLC